MTTLQDSEVLTAVHEGFRRVGLTFPYLSGLIGKLQVQLDCRVETMGVFASGRLVVNPEFAQKLSANDLIFVLTHELYHLLLRTHERGEGSDPLDFNFAHDYIINDMLREELQVTEIPAGGLDWVGARQLSAEKIMSEMQQEPGSRPRKSWDQSDGGVWGEGEGEWGEGQGDGKAGKDAGEGVSPVGDVLDGDLEKKWFPDANARDQKARQRDAQDTAAKALSMQALMESMRGQGRGTSPGQQNNTVAALRGLYRPPWELALQRWLDSVAPSERSYARPSRRGADRRDLVLPGRKREGWTMHVVLDTSGSMTDEVPKALGAIADFCDAVGVDRVHLIQCDTEVGSDEILTPQEIADWRVTGYGGSDLGPAMLRLAENPEVGAAIVLTDGDIDYPQEPVPYNVLWVLPSWKNPNEFAPRYGKVIAMTHS